MKSDGNIEELKMKVKVILPEIETTFTPHWSTIEE